MPPSSSPRRGEVLGTGRATLLRHTLAVGDRTLLTAVFTTAGRIKAIYADTPEATATAFGSAVDHADWAREMIRQRDPLQAA